MNIFLVRHGETDKEIEKNDWKYSITPKGQEQAKIAGAFLQDFFEKNHLNLSNTAILYSPYIRTSQTCNYIADIFKIEPKKMFETIEYQKTNEHLQKTPDTLLSILENNPMLTKIYNNAPIKEDDGNETPEEIILRAKSFVSSLDKLNYENVIVITHNGFIRAFNIAFNNLSVVEYFKKQSIKNCSIRHYEITPTKEHIDHGEILHKTSDFQME